MLQVIWGVSNVCPGSTGGELRQRVCSKYIVFLDVSDITSFMLAINANPDVFERLSLEPSHWGGIGSMIPDMQERIEYLRSLLPLVSGIKYLKQKQRIESEIGCWKERIHSEEVRELLESWYC